jgi:uncharacterized membrane protein
MIALLSGLVVFLGVHSLRVLSPAWREAQIARLGASGWKGAVSLASLAGLALIAWGFGAARETAGVIWVPPHGMHHATALFVLVAFVLLAAAYVPGTRIRAATGHPMTLGVKAWAAGHLLSNGTTADVVLFGAFLAWSIVVYVVARRRDRAAGLQRPRGDLRRDGLALLAGVLGFLLFAVVLHVRLFGVNPFAA